MDTTILTDTRNALGDYLGDDFNSQILFLINSSMLPLTQMGCISELADGISEETTWGDIVESPASDVWDSASATNLLFAIKQYVYLQVKLLFDPPVASAIVELMKQKSDEMLWRIEVAYHGDSTE